MTTSPWRRVVLIVATAILLRLAVFAYLSGEPRKFYAADSAEYERLAANLLEQHGFSSETAPPYHHNVSRTPLYPALLAAVFGLAGSAPKIVVLIQIALGGLTALFTFVIGRNLGLPKPASEIAAWCVALEPVSSLTANQLLTETLFTSLVAAGLALFTYAAPKQRTGWLAASGATLALAALTRPIAQFLPWLLALILAGALPGPLLRRMPRVLAFLLVSLGLTYSWALYNFSQTGLWAISDIGDMNLLYYRARAVLADAAEANNEQLYRQLQAQVRERVLLDDLSVAEEVALTRQEALEVFRRYPALTLKMTLLGLARLLADPGYTVICAQLDLTRVTFDCFPGQTTMNEPSLIDRALEGLRQMTPLQWAVMAWSSLLLLALYSGAGLGVAALLRQRNGLAVLILLITLLYFVSLSAGAEANSRFRIPVIPALAVLASAGWQACLRPGARWPELDGPDAHAIITPIISQTMTEKSKRPAR